MAEVEDAETCGVRYERRGGAMPGDRIVQCGRKPHAVRGSHREDATGFTWRSHEPAPPRDPPGLTGAITVAQDKLRGFARNSHEIHLVEAAVRAVYPMLVKTGASGG